ncbi:CKLF-like MARVEL transmembrane domain-containing protein 4 [Aplysia californica]|uniref:CKLF-like MARVEL transmembrane domain-containing protein 4 n=1 Tax=Aplysia californica TaxID=6500 RepID=A0ABM0K5Q6_APLCA|nr:CKLF-like MARVEL transmembrane domain-containing protein 4 [Aplysia californica]
MADVEASASQPQDGNIVYLWKIPVDKGYVKSLDSVLKVVAAALSFIAFICCASGRSDHCDDQYSSTYNYFEFVSISAFLTLLILWIFYALTLRSRLFFKLLPWNLVDLIYLAVYIIFYAIASIVLAAQPCGKDSNKAGAAFGFFTLGCLCANAFFSFQAWRGSRMESSADTGKSPEYNAERNMEQY